MTINGSDYGTLSVTAMPTDRTFDGDSFYMMRYSRIYCPNYDECNFNSYIAWTYAEPDWWTTDIDIYGGLEGVLNVNCHEERACHTVDIHLDRKTDLKLTCDAEYACRGIDVFYTRPQNDALDAKVWVNASGDYALLDATIRCPDLSNADSSCAIHASGDYIHMMRGLQIWTFNSFDDVDLVCDFARSYEMNCAPRNGGEGYMPLMGCNGFGSGTQSEISNACYFQLISGDNSWECTDVSNECALTERTEYEETYITSDDNRFICNEYRECAGRKYQCLDDMDCLFNCAGEESCAYATFICPSTANQCTVSIFDNVAWNLTVDASQSNGGTLIVSNDYVGGDWNLRTLLYGKVLCPNNGHCNVTCSGWHACANVEVISQEWTKLFVIADGGWQWHVLEDMEIYCPNNTVSGFNDDCYVIAIGSVTSHHMLLSMDIYALEGVHDVYMRCQYGDDGFWDDCMYNQSSHWSSMHCGVDYQHTCSLRMNGSVGALCANKSSPCMRSIFDIDPNVDEPEFFALMIIVVVVVIVVFVVFGICLYYVWRKKKQMTPGGMSKVGAASVSAVSLGSSRSVSDAGKTSQVMQAEQEEKKKKKPETEMNASSVVTSRSVSDARSISEVTATEQEPKDKKQEIEMNSPNNVNLLSGQQIANMNMDTISSPAATNPEEKESKEEEEEEETKTDEEMYEIAAAPPGNAHATATPDATHHTEHTQQDSILDAEEMYKPAQDVEGGGGGDDATNGTATGENEGEGANSMDVREWLETEVELPQYTAVFMENGFDSMKMIRELTELKYLEDLGITIKAHQYKILNCVNKLNRKD